jgi:hypothetical protein
LHKALTAEGRRTRTTRFSDLASSLREGFGQQ